MAGPIQVLAFSGSLRKASFNTALLHAAIALSPPELEIEVSDDLRGLPHYDDDVSANGFPEPVVKFREKVAKAHAVLIVTPEYNYSIPGVLKNAIDWASRAPAQPFAGKPLGIMGASGGMSGTMRAQYHLRQVAVFLDMHVMNKPEIFVSNAKTRFDESHALTDDATKKVVAAYMLAFRDFSQKIKGAFAPV